MHDDYFSLKLTEIKEKIHKYIEQDNLGQNNLFILYRK